MKTGSSQIQLEALINPQVRSVKPYVPGKPIEEVARQFRLQKKEVVKLASNENALGPSPKAMEAIAQTLPNIHQYPEGSGEALREKIAARLKIQSEQIILGNGSNEILELITRAFLRQGESAVTAEHTFSLYENFSVIVGARVVWVPLKDFTFDLVEMAKRITPSTKLVFICNPNNPTGTVVSHEALRQFIDGIKTPTLVVLDEAYGDFRDDGGFQKSREFLTRPNVVLLRTFSKLFGLAGLRIGYGLGNAKLIDILNRVRQPFNVNKLAQVAALAALEDSAHERKSLRLVRDEKKFLCAGLKKLGVKFIPSQANFICIKVGHGARVCQKLMERGVILRPLDSFGLPEFIRVTIGTRAENKRFLAALNRVCNIKRKVLAT